MDLLSLAGKHICHFKNPKGLTRLGTCLCAILFFLLCCGRAKALSLPDLGIGFWVVGVFLFYHDTPKIYVCTSRGLRFPFQSSLPIFCVKLWTACKDFVKFSKVSLLWFV